MNKKAQLSIINLMSWFVLVILASLLTLILQPFISDAAANAAAANQTLQVIVIYAIIPFMWLAIIMVLMHYAQPQSYFRQY